MTAIRHRRIEIDGLKVFVREAGDPSKPSIVLLPGYPSSTRAYVRLIDRLAPSWHVVAIDYPGFGSSDPLPESPTFDRLAEVTGKAIDALGIGAYAIYMFDFGAPVGFRIAVQHDQRVHGIITQNGNAYVDGFGPGLAALGDWWQDREAGQAAVDGFVSLAGTQLQWQAGAFNVEHIDSEQAHADQLVIDLPGRADYMKSLLWDYQNNPPLYPEWQAWLRRRQPKLTAVWGKNDPFFIPAGAEAYARDVTDAEVILLDTGHFALEEEADTVAELTHQLLRSAFVDSLSDETSNSRALLVTKPTRQALPLPRVTGATVGPVAVVSAFYDALQAEDAQRALVLLSPNTAWYEMPGMPYARKDGSPHRGTAEIAQRVLGPQGADVEDLELVEHEMLGYGNTVIMLGTVLGRGRKTGRRLEAAFAHVWVIEENLVREFRQYIDPIVFRSAVE